MPLITEVRVDPDLRRSAVRLQNFMLKFLDLTLPATEEHLVESECIRQMVLRYIADARGQGHPTTAHAPQFYPIWRDFNAAYDRLRDRTRPTPPPPAEASPELLASLGMPADVDTATLRRGAILAKYGPLDNNTGIIAFRTDFADPVDGQRDYYSEEELANCAWTARKLGHAPDARLNPNLTFAPTPLAPQPLAPPPPAPVAAPIAPAFTPPNAQSPRLSEIVKIYLDDRHTKFGDRRADEDDGRVLEFAIALLGDPQVDAIGKKELGQLEKALTEIPHRQGVPKRSNGSMYKRYLYAQEKGWDRLTRLSVKTLSNCYFRTMNNFLAFARTKTDWAAPDYPFNTIPKTAEPAQPRDAFSEDELIRLFNLPLFTGAANRTQIWTPGSFLVQSHIYWAFLLLFFCGMRPSEIGKLTVDDFTQEKDIWFVDLRGTPDEKARTGHKRRLKTEAAYRRVPLPKLLVDLGLIDRVNEMKRRNKKRLFPDWTVYKHPKSGREMWGHAFSKIWQYMKKSLGFDRDFLTLYSGRHTRAGWYDSMNLPQRTRNRLLGHKSKDVADNYGPIHLSHEEAKMAIGQQTEAERKVGEILLEAKARVERGELRLVVG